MNLIRVRGVANTNSTYSPAPSFTFLLLGFDGRRFLGVVIDVVVILVRFLILFLFFHFSRSVGVLSVFGDLRFERRLAVVFAYPLTNRRQTYESDMEKTKTSMSWPLHFLSVVTSSTASVVFVVSSSDGMLAVVFVMLLLLLYCRCKCCCCCCCCC